MSVPARILITGKRWLEEKLKHLVANSGIDLLAFSCMSNHFHLLLRSRPDVVATWDDTQVALRWWQLFPIRKVKLEINGEWVKTPATLLTPCKRHSTFYGIVTVIVLVASSVASMVPKSIALTTS